MVMGRLDTRKENMKATRLPSGSYRVRVTINKQTYSFTNKSKKEALKEAGIFLATTTERLVNPTFKDAMEDYISENEKILSAATIKGYVSLQKNLLAKFPAFCNKNIVSINSGDVQKVLMGLNVSPKSVKNYLNFIQPVCGKKFTIRFPQKEKIQPHVPTDLEVAGLLRLFEGTELEIPILLAAYGPLRRGEICALTLDDFNGDTVTVSKDIVRDKNNNWVLKPPKTFSSNRTITLPHFIVEKIRQRGYITKYNADRITHEFRRGQQRIGVEKPYNFHSLRHYCASTLHARGIPDEYIMERGGWASPNILTSVYRHTLQDKSAEMSSRAVQHFEDVANLVSR